MNSKELKVILLKDIKKYKIQSGPEVVEHFNNAYCNGFKYKEYTYRSDLYTKPEEMYDIEKKIDWLVENRMHYLDDCFSE